MKKLICSLMVATMLFGTVVCVSKSSIFESYVFASESDYGSDYDYDYGEEIPASDYEKVASDDENYCVEQHTQKISREATQKISREATRKRSRKATRKRSKATHKECEELNKFLNDSDEATLKFDYFKTLLEDDKYSIEEVIKAVVLKIFTFRDYVKPEDIVDTVFYLVNNGINYFALDERTKENIYLSVPDSLSTDEGRISAMRAIADFCNRFGAICVLATGDVIDKDGKIYNYKGEEYSEDGQKLICADNGSYWYTNNRRLTKSFNYAYGIFVLPDKRCFSCNYKGTSENSFIDLSGGKDCEWNEPISEDVSIRRKIIISTEGVTLDNGIEFRPMETDNKFGYDEEYVLKQIISQVIFGLIRCGYATEYIEYTMRYLPYIDKNIAKQIYGDDKKLRNFVLNNFCNRSLNIAIESLRKNYENKCRLS